MNPESTDGTWLDPQTLQTSAKELAPKALELATDYGVTLVGALVVLVISWVLSGWVRRGVSSLLGRTHVDATVSSFLSTTARWAVLILGVIICLGVFGVEMTSLAALLGGAGVGIGVALQGNLANLASGLVLIAFRPFSSGDWIELEDADVDGRIRSVGLLFTEIDTFQNRRILVPNQLLLGQPVTNNEMHPTVRADVQIGVGYGTDLRESDEVLRNTARRVQEEHGTDGEFVVWWTGFGASSIDAKVGVWCRAADLFPMKNELLFAIHEDLAEAGIEIPFPQRDLHLRSPRVERLEQWVENAAK